MDDDDEEGISSEEVEQSLDSGVEGEEKEEMMEELEEKILDKLKEENILVEDKKDDKTTSGEFFGFGKKETKEEVIERLKRHIRALENAIKEEKEKGNTKRANHLKDILTDFKAKVENFKVFNSNDLPFKLKKNTPYICFHRGTTDYGRAISLITRGPYSHVDIIMNGKVYTALDPGGVDEYTLPKDKEVIVYELSKKVKPKKILEFFKKTKGAPYDFKRAIKAHILGQHTEENFNSFFCSQWVTACLDYATDFQVKYKGKRLTDFGYDMIHPNALFRYLLNDDFLIKRVKEIEEG